MKRITYATRDGSGSPDNLVEYSIEWPMVGVMSRKSAKLSKKEMKEVALRMAEKQKWKELPGNRYTPQELNKMSDSLQKGNLTIRISKNVMI